MNSDQFQSIFRSVLISLGAGVAAKYGLDGSVVPAVAGGIVAAAGAAWGLYFHAGATKDKLEKVVAGEPVEGGANKVIDKALKSQGVA